MDWFGMSFPFSWMSCPHCEKKYPSAKKLNFHVDAQHSETRDQLDFFCVWPGCARGFSSEDNLKHHVKGHYSRAKKKVGGFAVKLTSHSSSFYQDPQVLA